MRILKIQKKSKNQSGIALFMVITTIALLAILVTELTYTTQINSRMAYNGVDNLKAYYLAKSGIKISLIRLSAFMQIQKFISETKMEAIKKALSKDVVDKVWNFPFIYPIPIPKDSSESDSDTIKKFMADSAMKGSFTANISSEGSKLNLNNLLIKQVVIPPAGTQPGNGTAPKNPAPPKPQQQTQQQGEVSPVLFSPIAEAAIAAALENKKESSREFEDLYKTLTAKDIVDAIQAYLFKDAPASNLPGFRPMTPKEAPLYSLTELHAIPGLDDELYNLVAPLFTVNSTAGINVNTASKAILQAMLPQASSEDIADMLRHRDDPDVGKPWEKEEDFWQSVQSTGAARSIENAKDALKKANLKIITSELCFKINVTASVGLSSKAIEAYVILKPSETKATTPAKPPIGGGAAIPTQPKQPAASTQDNSSAKPSSGLHLVYWRVL